MNPRTRPPEITHHSAFSSKPSSVPNRGLASPPGFAATSPAAPFSPPAAAGAGEPDDSLRPPSRAASVQSTGSTASNRSNSSQWSTQTRTARLFQASSPVHVSLMQEVSCSVSPYNFFRNCRDNTYDFRVRDAFCKQIYQGRPLPDGLIQTGPDISLEAGVEAEQIMHFMRHASTPELLTRFPVKAFDRYKYQMLLRFAQQYAAENPELLHWLMQAPQQAYDEQDKAKLRAKIIGLSQTTLAPIYQAISTILTADKTIA